jgi:hypothetical protein
MGHKESKAFSEAKYARAEKRWICNHRHARKMSRRYNKVARIAAKLTLHNYKE